MREYVFLLEYDRGVHPVRDVFIDHLEVVATALAVSITLDSGWRVERLTGPEHALDAVEAVYFDEHCNDCTYPTPACDTELEYQVLEREPTARTVYRHSSLSLTHDYLRAPNFQPAGGSPARSYCTIRAFSTTERLA